MRLAIRTMLLTAVGLAGAAAAPAALAQAYGQPYAYDRYPPPPPLEGQVFPRDDRYVEGPLTHNSDGSLGYRPYASQPDTTPDDPGRIAYDAERDRRVAEARGYRDEAYAPPPPPSRYGYSAQGYAQRPYRDDDGYAPRYERRYDRPYDRPHEREIYVAPAPSDRGW